MDVPDRTEIFFASGASLEITRELLAYSSSALDPARLKGLPRHFPLVPEMHVEAWQEYAAEAAEVGVLAALKRRLVQLNFPIRQGMSKSMAYLAAVRQGKPVELIAEATGLLLKRPDRLQLRLHPCLGGVIPAIITGERDDFVTLAQALVGRNEPVAFPAAVGSFMVKGYNNWDRVRRLRRHWESENPSDISEEAWAAEFTHHLFPHKQLFQDSFLILSDGPYSGVPAAEMELSEEAWQRASLEIRLEHESTHYFLYRLLGTVRNHVLDELLADYRGIAAAAGRYRADWFLRFMGLESYPQYRKSGRLEYYRGNPPLSDGAFDILQGLVYKAAGNLQRFDEEQGAKLLSLPVQSGLLIALASLTLEELSVEEVTVRLEQALSGFI